MIAVIGAGPAGCMAALAAADSGAAVRLLEQNEKVGKKWYITGKGRCNLTNDQDMPAHLEHVRRNPKFLLGAYARCTKDDVKTFFESAGVPLKTERGGRVFPVSDKSSDTIFAFERALQKAGVRLDLSTKVLGIEREDGKFRIATAQEVLRADAVVIATGGLSYPTTGATGDGYRFAKTFGHRIKPLVPSLVGLNLKDPMPQLAGLSLRNVSLHVKWGKKKKEWFGELLFTHYGLSGPIVLQMSAEVPEPAEAFPLFLNLKPALSKEMLDRRLIREVEAAPAKQLATVLQHLLPSSLVPEILGAAGLDAARRAAQLTAKERRRLGGILQAWPLKPAGFRGFNEAVITRGGVATPEVDAKTMMSKKQDGIFFAGEVLDLDADTGGYNMQIAWSTGFVAGQNAARYAQKGK